MKYPVNGSFFLIITQHAMNNLKAYIADFMDSEFWESVKNSSECTIL